MKNLPLKEKENRKLQEKEKYNFFKTPLNEKRSFLKYKIETEKLWVKH